MEARPLAELAVPGLELCRGLAIADDGVDPRADFLHLFEVGILKGRQHVRPVRSSRGNCWILARMRRDRSVQPSWTRSSSAVPPAWFAVKFSSQRCCQPGDAMAENQFGIDRRVGADIDRRRRALENVELLAGAGQIRHALHGRGAGADDADALVGELFHRRARGIAAGVVVIPPAGVERMSLEVFDAGNARKFRARAAARCPCR